MSAYHRTAPDPHDLRGLVLNNTIMAKKQYTSLVDARIGSNEDGSPRLLFKVGAKIELSLKQARYYKSIKYIK